MADQSYRERSSQQEPGYSSDADRVGPGWVSGSGLSRVIAILLFIILLLLVIWALVSMFSPLQYCTQCTWFSKTFQGCQCTPGSIGGDPPAGALAECDQQLARGRFSIPGQTAHERYLTETLPSMKPQMYVMVTLRKQVIGSASDAESALSSVAVEVHRPNDADPQNNLDAFCSRAIPEATTASANSGGVSEVRWRMFCDLSRLQYDQQEQLTGLLKYRVLIKNWSRESVDYCLVSSCDANYPAGEACGGGAYGAGAYPSASVSGGGSTGQ
jgi:hypothetical protein